jgi:tRNA threonylcarbamoyladenosine biosynthesis protein TsaB
LAHILSIESATELCSIAVADGGHLLALRESKEARTHTQVITLLIDQVLEDAKLDYSDLDAVAISSGPGSYTSLRIGTSTAKGICFGLGLPLIAVDTLHSLAMRVANDSKHPYDKIVSTIDARRMEVYEARFDANGKRISKDKAIIYSTEYFDSLSPQDVVCGTGVQKVVKDLEEHYIPYAEYTASAKYMTSIAEEKYNRKDFVDLAYFTPNYIKPVRIIKSKKKLL